MRPSRILLIFAMALAAGSAFAPSANAQDVQFSPYYPRPQFFQMGGACEMEISPDKAAIVGGVSSSGLKPTDVAEQLDKKLALIKSYVNEKHGELQLLERVRTLKNPPPPEEKIQSRLFKSYSACKQRFLPMLRWTPFCKS